MQEITSGPSLDVAHRSFQGVRLVFCANCLRSFLRDSRTLSDAPPIGGRDTLGRTPYFLPFAQERSYVGAVTLPYHHTRSLQDVSSIHTKHVEVIRTAIAGVCTSWAHRGLRARLKTSE